MTDPRAVPIDDLIERSSLGSSQARLARSRVPLSRGESLAKAAAERAKRRAVDDDRVRDRPDRRT